MKRIEIKSYIDIKNIDLNGYEDYYIFVDLPYEIHTEAIDLSSFKGSIYLSLDNRRHKLHIKTSNIKDSYLFFEGITGKEIFTIGRSDKYYCEYECLPKTVHIKDELELRSIIKSKGQKEIILDNDIIIHDKNSLNIPEDKTIISKKYHIFYPATMIISYPKKYNNIFKFINQSIVIKNQDDITKLYNMNANNILIEFKTDIQDITLKSIIVPNVVNKLYVVGKGHSIKNTKIIGNTYNGLFGYIPAKTEVYISDLNMQYVYLKCHPNNTRCAGLLIGTHGDNKNLMAPNKIIINNCSFKQSLINKCSMYAGIISGSFYDETKVTNCEINQVIYNNSYLYSLFGSHEIFDMAYYENDELETSLKLKRTKNV